MARNYLQSKNQIIMVGFKRQQGHLSKKSEGEAVTVRQGKYFPDGEKSQLTGYGCKRRQEIKVI